MPTVTLDDVADVRAGDKGDALMLSVFPRDPAVFGLLQAQLTGEAVARHFGAAVTGRVIRTVLPRLPALVFKVPGVLAGGVTGSTVLDGHGKTLSYHLLTLELPIRSAAEREVGIRPRREQGNSDRHDRDTESPGP